jgi:hypothetical protein
MMKQFFTLLLPACLLPAPLAAQPSVWVEYQATAGSAEIARVSLLAIPWGAEHNETGIVRKSGDLSEMAMKRLAFVEEPDAWMQMRLRNVPAEAYRWGWRLPDRQQARQAGQQALRGLAEAGVLLEDPMLHDYLGELLLRLHPLPLANHHPQAECHLRARVLAQEQARQAALPDGTLLLPIQQLLSFRSERDLAQWLCQLIAFVEADLPLARYNPDYNAMDAFTPSSSLISKLNASVLVWMAPQLDRMAWADSASFVRRLAPALQYAGWLEYQRQNYQAALRLCDRLIVHEAATTETFLLKALIYKQIYNTPMALQTAYSYLVRAESLSETPRSEVMAEKALLLIRMQKLEEALKVLEGYRQLMERQQNLRELIWAEDMIRHCRAEAGGALPSPAAQREKAPE